jgi:hypothetical protein
MTIVQHHPRFSHGGMVYKGPAPSQLYIFLSAMSIQFFPSEILAQIFATASPGNKGMIELTHVSAVSSRHTLCL